MCHAMLNPPADSPKMCTREGSPPKDATLSRAHSMAAVWSCSAALPVLLPESSAWRE